ncbi:hypothetical protein FAZ19_09780 [Sphingobacterium alkalisoli]|uniref:Uncharacterized protein n=1 Tax=Sphingobacterium alkalisoli TaxID=1874115 RepID=A0A4V5LY74_9SPHI|nr:hypothetical protein [Sphingobacterium alkalisoli]TJY65429.1 hypothetical protein FAZ19_09780 [Sphingobacterium alkalisoli]GGH20516.1 hypothetical protein GCM10011418_25790 [Sphingobacterium alkalisoli]
MKKISRRETVEDTNVKPEVVDFSQRLSGNLVIKCLLDRDLRNEFILNYSHFEKDGNRSILVQWINEHLTSSNNELLENIFDLSVNIDFYGLELLSKAEEIVSGRYYELTKLAVLDWVLFNSIKIEPLRFYTINCTAFKKTKQRLVKLQAAVNLTLYDDVHLSKVSTILMKEHYPTAFYRLVNSFDHMDDKKRQVFINLIENSFNTMLNKNVIHDLELKINEYR